MSAARKSSTESVASCAPDEHLELKSVDDGPIQVACIRYAKSGLELVGLWVPLS